MSRRLYVLACVCFMIVLLALPSSSWSQEPPPPPPEQQPQEQEKESPREPSVSLPGQLIMPRQDYEVPAEERPAPTAAVAPAARQKDDKDIYIIVKGDTLWDISHSFLKDPFLWPLIWKVNPYIANPDLIYPGNKLVIPGLEQIERAIERPAERAVEREVPGEREVAALPRPRPTKPKEEEVEETPRPRKLILPEEMRTPIIDKFAMLSAGFVQDNMETDDRVVGSLEPKTIFAYDDILYITLPSQEHVDKGDRFLIYAPLRNVRHPETGSNFGRLIRVLGILQVTAKDEATGVHTARVTLSFDAIKKGDLLTPYQEPVLIYDRPAAGEPKDLQGYILEVVDGRTINAQIDIVYLDVGTQDGVEPGDRFTVFIEPRRKNFPRTVLGEVQVFLVKERTATGIVKKSVDVLAKGDRIEYKK